MNAGHASTARLLSVAGAVLLLAVVATAAWVRGEFGRAYAGWDGPSVDVEVTPGMSARQTIRRLGDAGVLRRPGLLARWVALRGLGGEIQAGEYRFDFPATPLEVLDRIVRGDVLLHAVTVPEGLDVGETATRIAEQGFGPVEALLAAFRDPAPVLDLDPEAEDLEGYLFPETYHFPRGATPGAIAETMVARFREAATSDYAARAASVGLTLRQAVTLASMIERETSRPEERARISTVFHNRLARGMRLQCDPTVVYALRRAGRTPARLTYRDLEFDSPWNTYVVRGLPPGPIASPGRPSLDAAVNPVEGSELYFVASPDGGHRFSETLEQHVQAVAEWRRYLRSSR